MAEWLRCQAANLVGIARGSSNLPRCDFRDDDPISTTWPSGLRRWSKVPVRKGVGSNPTVVNIAVLFPMAKHAFARQVAPFSAWRPKFALLSFRRPTTLLPGRLRPFLHGDQCLSGVKDSPASCRWNYTHLAELPAFGCYCH